MGVFAKGNWNGETGYAVREIANLFSWGSFTYTQFLHNLSYRDIGTIIQKHAQSGGFSVVRSYCGHGIHRLFHTAPSIPHYSSESRLSWTVFTRKRSLNDWLLHREQSRRRYETRPHFYNRADDIRRNLEGWAVAGWMDSRNARWETIRSIWGNSPRHRNWSRGTHAATWKERTALFYGLIFVNLMPHAVVHITFVRSE